MDDSNHKERKIRPDESLFKQGFMSLVFQDVGSVMFEPVKSCLITEVLGRPHIWKQKKSGKLSHEQHNAENCCILVKPQGFYNDYIFLVLHICRLFAFLSVFVCGAAVQGKSTDCYLLHNKEETPAAGVKTFTEQLDKNKRLNSWLMKNLLFLFVLTSSWLTVQYNLKVKKKIFNLS